MSLLPKHAVPLPSSLLLLMLLPLSRRLPPPECGGFENYSSSRLRQKGASSEKPLRTVQVETRSGLCEACLCLCAVLISPYGNRLVSHLLPTFRPHCHPLRTQPGSGTWREHSKFLVSV